MNLRVAACTLIALAATTTPAAAEPPASYDLCYKTTACVAVEAGPDGAAGGGGVTSPDGCAVASETCFSVQASGHKHVKRWPMADTTASCSLTGGAATVTFSIGPSRQPRQVTATCNVYEDYWVRSSVSVTAYGSWGNATGPDRPGGSGPVTLCPDVVIEWTNGSVSNLQGCDPW